MCCTLEKPWQACIVDFGQAWINRPGFRPTFSDYTHGGDIRVVTLPYRAPEIILADPAFGTAIDVWACGVLLAAVVHPCLFYHPSSTHSVDTLELIFRKLGSPSGPSMGRKAKGDAECRCSLSPPGLGGAVLPLLRTVRRVSPAPWAAQIFVGARGALLFRCCFGASPWRLVPLLGPRVARAHVVVCWGSSGVVGTGPRLCFAVVIECCTSLCFRETQLALKRLPRYKVTNNFPQYPAIDWAAVFEGLGVAGVALLRRMLELNPARPSAIVGVLEYLAPSGGFALARA